MILHNFNNFTFFVILFCVIAYGIVIPQKFFGQKSRKFFVKKKQNFYFSTFACGFSIPVIF